MQTAERISEVKDPICRAKLEGLQEAVSDIDATIVQLRKAIDEKRGVIAAAEAIAKRLHQECDPINRMVHDEQMEPKEAKVRINQIEKLVDVVRGIEKDNRGDHANLVGQVAGLEKAVKATENRFNNEAAKYERWERIQAEEEAERQAEAEAAAKAKSKPKKRVRAR